MGIICTALAMVFTKGDNEMHHMFTVSLLPILFLTFTFILPVWHVG